MSDSDGPSLRFLFVPLGFLALVAVGLFKDDIARALMGSPGQRWTSMDWGLVAALAAAAGLAFWLWFVWRRR